MSGAAIVRIKKLTDSGIIEKRRAITSAPFKQR
jgi:DNA-binding Lrp family transcriptional regulator